VQDDPRSGQPKTQRTDANVDRVRTLVRSDRRVGVRVYSSCQSQRLGTMSAAQDNRRQSQLGHYMWGWVEILTSGRFLLRGRVPRHPLLTPN